MAYSWRGGLPGGGFCNTGAFDTRTSGKLACGGDVWGPRTSATGGDLWLGAMWGCSPNNIPYGRSVVFSKRNPGVCYFGHGGLHQGIGAGGFATLVGHRFTNQNTAIGFGTSETVAPDGGNPAGFHPRPTGRQILVDYDTAADKEYIYACIPGYGLGRCSDNSQGQNWVKMGSVATPPSGLWKAGVILPSGNLLFYTYLTTQTSGTITYKVTTPRSTATVTTVGGAPAVVHDAAVSPTNNRVFAACGPNGVREVTSDGATWNPVAGNSFFSGFHPASIAVGSDGRIWVGTSDGSGHGTALSTDNGASWSWVMGSTHLNFSVMGANVPWWLQGRPDPTSSGYAVEQIEVNPFDATNIAAFGRGGAWMTHDSGATWRPSMYGMDGTEVASLGVGSGGAVGGTVADWSVFSSSDYLIHSANTSGPTGGGNTDSGGNTYTLVSGTPYDVRRNGVSIADDEFRGWCVKPSAIKVAANGTVYVGQFGGVHVGDPVSTPPPPVTAPTHGSPTIDQSNPQTTQTIHALANDGSWDGTKPLTYSAQWQSSTAASGGTWTTLATGVATTTFPGDTYVVQAGDLNRFLRARVTGTNSAGAFLATSPVSNQVTSAVTPPTITTAPVASPQAPAAGQPISCSTGVWANSPASYSGQWQTATTSTGSWSNISTGASTTTFPNDTYTPANADAGMWFRCRVTASNAAGAGTASASNAVGPVSTSTVTVTDAIQTPDMQTIHQGDQFTVVWIATTNSPTGIAASQVQVDGGPWQNGDMIGDDGAGTTTWQYTFQTLAVGTHLIVTRDVVNT